ncbi:MAG: cupin domain-containing protein [Pseudomonadota bacterium]
MPRVDPAALPTYDGPDAAAPFAGPLGDYIGRAVSVAHGLHLLGINIETLRPGAASSHRHWHDTNEEVVVVTDGTLVLIDDSGATELCVGDVAVFPANDGNGHCLENRSAFDATFVVIGTRKEGDTCHYADIDLIAQSDGTLTRRDGSPATP